MQTTESDITPQIDQTANKTMVWIPGGTFRMGSPLQMCWILRLRFCVQIHVDFESPVFRFPVGGRHQRGDLYFVALF